MSRPGWHPVLFVVVGLVTIAALVHGLLGTALFGVAILVWLL
jgi:hypothetical protein